MKHFRKTNFLFLASFLVLGLGACQVEKKSIPEGNLTQQDNQTKEEQQRNDALYAKVLVEHQRIRVISVDSSKLVLGLNISLNRIAKLFTFSMDLSEDWQTDNKISEIQTQFPGRYLLINAFKFKHEGTHFLGLEYSFSKVISNEEIRASQFVLLILDNELRPTGLLKNFFVFPNYGKTELRKWAQDSAKQAIGAL